MKEKKKEESEEESSEEESSEEESSEEESSDEEEEVLFGKKTHHNMSTLYYDLTDDKHFICTLYGHCVVYLGEES